MSVDTPETSPSTGARLVPTIAIIGEICANVFIIWYLLFDIPEGCARLAAETAGRQNCGIEVGAYVIAAISVVLILAGLYYLVKWYVIKKN
jgi:hypothetical protein